MMPLISHGTPNRGPHAAILLLFLLTAACRPDAGEGSEKERGESLRIAAMAPAAVEIIAALGGLDLVVAVGDYVEWPPAVKNLPAIGAYNTPNIEQILNLDVELFVTVRSEAGGTIHGRLRDLGVEVLELPLDTFDGTLEAIGILGRALGVETRARALRSEIGERMDLLRSRIDGIEARRVMVVVGTDPLYVAGPGSHFDEIMRAVGGVNIFQDALGTYQMVSLEAAIERRPEVIIDVSDNRAGAPRGRLEGVWARWPFLPAVRENRVYQVDPVRLTIPGPRLPEMTELMAKMIHPEVFGAVPDGELGPMDRHVP